MQFKMPDDFSFVLESFDECGFKAYIAGEDLFQLILGRTLHLCTILTTAQISDVKKSFKKCVDNGIDVRLTYDNTTYKIEHIDSVTDVLKESVFSVHTMYYSIKKGLVDNCGAMGDIENKVIRCVNDYEKYFAMNPVLMVKAVALCASFGFDLDKDTKREIRRHAVFLRKVRGDSLLPEINKILLSENPDYIRILNETMLLRFIMPQLAACFGEPQRNRYHIYDVGEHIMHAVKNVRADKVLRWAALLHDVGKPFTSTTDDNGIIHFYGHHKESKSIAEGLLHKLRMDTESISDILILIENHDVRIEPTLPMVKRLMSKTGPELFLKLMELQEADNKAKNMNYFKTKKAKIDAIRHVYGIVIESNEPYMINHLIINAKDLAKIGLKKGKMTNDLLRCLLGEVIVNPSLNNREYLIKRARQIKAHGG